MAPQPEKVFNPRQLRRTIIEMAYAGNTVHIGCAFSIVEILAVLYRQHLHFPGNEPKSPERDFLVLSKGHGVMAQYACMRELGWIGEKEVRGYFSDGSNLKGLSDSRVPGLEVTSGSLGHGFSVGVGMAMGAKLKGSDQKTYIVVGDGELNEGPIWEGALFASHQGLGNLMVIVDENGFQAMGRTREIMNLSSIQKKFEAFGFDAVTIDGHDEHALDEAINTLWAGDPKKPKAIVAKTVKGKGVAFMEDDNIWHYTRLNPQTYERAMFALRESDE